MSDHPLKKYPAGPQKSGLFRSAGKPGQNCPDIPNVPWNQDTRPFGYQGVRDLLGKVFDALKEVKE